METLSLVYNYHPTTGYKTEEIEQHISDIVDFINNYSPQA